MNEDIQKILQDNDVDKISFYFINTPLINNAFTTCVFINSSKQRIEARGVSICSLRDRFCKSEGKNKAFGRAIRALVRKENNWKINGTGRNDEFVKRNMKIKTESDENNFRTEIAEELKRIDPNLPVTVITTKGCKKYSFNIPVSYPVVLANCLYKYKSHYKPTPSGVDERELIRKTSIFTEPINDSLMDTRLE